MFVLSLSSNLIKLWQIESISRSMPQRGMLLVLPAVLSYTATCFALEKSCPFFHIHESLRWAGQTQCWHGQRSHVLARHTFWRSCKFAWYTLSWLIPWKTGRELLQRIPCRHASALYPWLGEEMHFLGHALEWSAQHLLKWDRKWKKESSIYEQAEFSFCCYLSLYSWK